MSQTDRRVVEIKISPKGEISIQTRNLLETPAKSGYEMSMRDLPDGSFLILVTDVPPETQ